MEMTNDQVSQWFEAAEPGERLVYKIGKTLPQKDKGWLVSTAALEVRKLYDAGLVDLSQRAIGKPVIMEKATPSKFDRDFEYIVIKRAQPQRVDALRTFEACFLTGDALAA